MIKVEKVFGWFLLLLGVTIICWSLYQSFNIFTGRAQAPEVFKLQETGEPPLSQGQPQDFESQAKEMMGEQLKQLLPTDSLGQLFNLISWSIFVGILSFGGAQISSLGIKLIKK